MRNRNLRCPNCHKAVVWEGNLTRPFCSERCRLIDLQGWMGERYRIAQDDNPDSEETQETNEH